MVIKQNPRQSIPKKIKAKGNFLFYLFYIKIEKLFFRPKPNAFTKRDLSEFLNGVPRLEVSITETKNSDYFGPEDTLEIRKFELDLFIRVGFRILRGDILNSTKFGIWSYHHGDNFVYRGGPAGVWEVLNKSGSTGSILQILNDDLDNGKVIYRSWSHTGDTIIQNTNNFYWKSLSLLPRKLKELHDIGETEFFRKLDSQNRSLSFYSDKLYQTPGNLHFFFKICKHLLGLFKSKLWLFFNFKQWILLYSYSKENIISSSIFRYKKLLPPKDKFWADPCVVFRNNKHYIFIEEYSYEKKRGHISVFEADDKMKFSTPVVILEKPYHLSYPFVFESHGQMYMIPESSGNKTIELYVSSDFPYQWKLCMNLMEDVYAVDTTICFHENKYWMFTNIQENEGASTLDELFIFYADDLLTTEWHPHKKNPVVSDVRKARPAGKLFSVDGCLYRPSQDCSTRYGHKIIFNEILILDENHYEERMVTAITPNWHKKMLATHTFSYEQGLTFIDAQLNRSR